MCHDNYILVNSIDGVETPKKVLTDCKAKENNSPSFPISGFL